MTGAVGKARADFIGYYVVSDFTLSNTGGLFPNGTVSSPNTGTVILTGSNDGSGIGGATTLTIIAPASGMFDFSWTFDTQDQPNFESAGYLLGGVYFALSGTNNASGSIAASVSSGEQIGFEVQTVDNTGSPGILSITNFSAPPPPSAPEPGSGIMLLFGAVSAVLIGRRLSGKWLDLRRLRNLVALTGLGLGYMALPVAAQQPYVGSPVTGQLTLINSVNLQQLPMGAQSLRTQGATNDTPRLPTPLLHPPYQQRKLLGAGTLSANPTTSLSVVSASGVFGFNALSHLDQKNSNGASNFSLEPPNQSVAVGNGYVVEGVNQAYEVYTTSGAPTLPTILAMNQVFGFSPENSYTTPCSNAIGATNLQGPYMTDTRVFYDSLINRWLIVERSQDEDPCGDELNSSHLYLAVSQGGDPTAAFNIYSMNTTNASHPGCPCIDDYPQIGADQYGFHVAWNEFNTASQDFVDVSILSISKADLQDGAATPSSYQYILKDGTGFEFAIQPATTPPNAANFVGPASGGLEYLISTSSNFESNNQLMVWALTNTSSLATGNPNLTLSKVVVPTVTYTTPSQATQPHGTYPLGTSVSSPLELIDGGDTRVQSLTYAAGNLYVTWPTAVTDQSGNNLVGAAYAVLSPTFRSGAVSAQVLNQGYLMVAGNNLLRPALAVNAQGKGTIGITLVGTNGPYYPSAAVIPFQSSAIPTTLQILAPGALPEDGFTGYPAFGGSGVARWGDYNTTVVAPDNSLWTVVQYIGNYPRTTYANWNTYVAQIQP